MEIYIFIIVVLVALAISDLIVGVSNDAVNFLNSSIGSKVAPRYVIMIIASLGILAGVTFSSGMMEVARKGIFHPQYFYMPEIMVIFLAVMITDIILLDLFNTFGLPTSTTVSIVFELLGAAVAVSLIKIHLADGNYALLGTYINTGQALVIIFGILLSVVIAFVFGAVIQFVSRLIFTFDYKARLKKYGAVWGGMALSMIIYFILIKGAKGASFISEETLAWIKSNTGIMLLGCFIISSLILLLLQIFTKINILKPIVLIGTFALAMAFAANDLVNFIGVPLAGINAYDIAQSSGNALTLPMKALEGQIQSNTWILLGAGLIMVVTLWFSRKARAVTKTEVDLGRQDEGVERFSPSPPSRVFVRMSSTLFNSFKIIIPRSWQKRISQRLDQKKYQQAMAKEEEPPAFDLVRASVNLMVSSALVSFATSLKLPLSTTYVTFMVAMGTSLSDQAWGRESAVYRVTGVLTVIGGWFLTAIAAFTISMIIALPIYYFELPAIIVMLALALLIIWKNHHSFKTKNKEEKEIEVFNLRKIKEANFAINTTFKHTGFFLQEINRSLDDCFEGLFTQDRKKLKALKKKTQKFQMWANIIVANIYKTLRLLQKKDRIKTKEYSHTIIALQEIVESHRDIVMKSYLHTVNQHKGLLEVQIKELKKIIKLLTELLDSASHSLLSKTQVKSFAVKSRQNILKKYFAVFDENQIDRILDESSKTRLSILFYALMWDSQKIFEQTLSLLKIFKESFKLKRP